MGKSIATLAIKLVTDLSQYSSGMHQAGAQHQALTARIRTQSSALASGLAGFVTGGLIGGGITAMMKHALTAAQEMEASTRKLQAVLAATGHAAGFSAAELSHYAETLERTTGVEKAGTINAQAILATFRNVRGDVFKEATERLLDMSAVLGGDASTGAIRLGKALNDPERGLLALRRVGVSFTQDQIEMIKTLTKSGDVLGAQRIILRELKDEFGGAAEAMNTPIKQFNASCHELAITMGERLAPYAAAAAKAMTEMNEAAAAGVGGKAGSKTNEELGAMPFYKRLGQFDWWAKLGGDEAQFVGQLGQSAAAVFSEDAQDLSKAMKDIWGGQSWSEQVDREIFESRRKEEERKKKLAKGGGPKAFGKMAGYADEFGLLPEDAKAAHPGEDAWRNIVDAANDLVNKRSHGAKLADDAMRKLTEENKLTRDQLAWWRDRLGLAAQFYDRNQALADQAKKAEEDAKKLADVQKSHWRDLQHEADRYFDESLTPIEKLYKQMVEWDQLRGAGLMDDQTAGRLWRKGLGEFDQATAGKGPAFQKPAFAYSEEAYRSIYSGGPRDLVQVEKEVLKAIQVQKPALDKIEQNTRARSDRKLQEANL